MTARSGTAPDDAHGRALSPRTWYRRFRQRIFRTEAADRELVVLRHNRIYILPTGRGVAFLGALAMMLITSLNYALSLGFAVTFLLSGVGAAALLHAFRNLLGLELRPLAAGDAFVGSALPFTIAIAGGAIARNAISVVAEGCEPLTSDIPTDGARPLTLRRTALRRGRAPLGRVTLSSDHPLGLWHGWAYVHFPLSGIVYPSPEASAPPLPGGHAGNDAQSAQRGDDADLSGLRQYQPGDPMQRVAWKAVARGAGWHTKQFEGQGGGGPVALSWHALPPGLALEERLARLTAWVLAAERVARPFSLQIPGFALPAGQGRVHRRAALTALALYQADAQ